MKVSFTGIKNIITTDYCDEKTGQGSKHIVLQLDNNNIPDLANFSQVFKQYPSRFSNKTGVLEVDVFEKFMIDESGDDNYGFKPPSVFGEQEEEDSETAGTLAVEKREIKINNRKIIVNDAQVPILLKVARLLQNISKWPNIEFSDTEDDTTKELFGKILIKKFRGKDELPYDERLATFCKPQIIKDNAFETADDIISEIIIHLEGSPESN